MKFYVDKPICQAGILIYILLKGKATNSIYSLIDIKWQYFLEIGGVKDSKCLFLYRFGGG